VGKLYWVKIVKGPADRKREEEGLRAPGIRGNLVGCNFSLGPVVGILRLS